MTLSGDIEVQDEEILDGEENEDAIKASSMGWQSQDKWKGDPKEWRSAEDFLKRGQEIGLHMKRDIQSLRSQNSLLHSQVTEMKQSIAEFRDFAAQAEERSFQKALKELKTERREALKEGEHERVEDLEEQIDELRKEGIKITKPAQTPQVDPEFITWRSENQWFGQDPVMTSVAEGLAGIIAKQNPGLIGMEYYNKVLEAVQQELPHKFNIRQQRPNAVAGGSNGKMGSKQSGKSYNNLPTEAQRQCDKFIKQGYLKDRAEYCANYDWS